MTTKNQNQNLHALPASEAVSSSSIITHNWTGSRQNPLFTIKHHKTIEQAEIYCEKHSKRFDCEMFVNGCLVIRYTGGEKVWSQVAYKRTQIFHMTDGGFNAILAMGDIYEPRYGWYTVIFDSTKTNQLTRENVVSVTMNRLGKYDAELGLAERPA